jgi:hypothetical protein
VLHAAELRFDGFRFERAHAQLDGDIGLKTYRWH